MQTASCSGTHSIPPSSSKVHTQSRQSSFASETRVQCPFVQPRTRSAVAGAERGIRKRILPLVGQVCDSQIAAIIKCPQQGNTRGLKGVVYEWIGRWEPDRRRWGWEDIAGIAGWGISWAVRLLLLLLPYKPAI